MSTYQECRERGSLHTVGGLLGARQQPTRLLALSTETFEWMRNVLPTLETDGFFPGSVSPKQQAFLLFRTFVAGENFDPPLPHEMSPLGSGVWRLRTADLRFDGWFPERAFFVVAVADAKTNCTNARDNEMYQSVLSFREQLSLLGGTYLEGNLDELI